MASLQRLCHFLGVEWIGLPSGSSLGARVRTARVRRGNGHRKSWQTRLGFHVPLSAGDRGSIGHIFRHSVRSSTWSRTQICRPRKPIVRQYANLRDVRLTPPDFIEQVVHVLGQKLNNSILVAHRKLVVPATRQFFQEDDGLSQEWKARTIFINPPYTMATKFMRKAHEEWLSGSARCIVILVPARTHTKTFHEIAPDADFIFLKNYMRFWSEERTPMPHVAPFSSMVLILGGDEGVIERARASWNGVFVPRRNLNILGAARH